MEATNLGPTDAEHARSARSTFVFALSGSFKMCYKLSGLCCCVRSPYSPGTNAVLLTALAGGRYEQVGGSLINVNPSHRELVQTVSECHIAWLIAYMNDGCLVFLTFQRASMIGSAYTHISNSSHRLLHQVENLVEDCSHWHSDTKLVYEIGYARSIGVYSDGSGFNAGHFLHSECDLASRRGNSLIEFTVQLPRKVLTVTLPHNA